MMFGDEQILYVYMLIAFFGLFLIGYLIYILEKKQDKGAVGERMVAHKLASLPKSKYHVLNDIMLKTYYGSTQIDHIVVSIYGIFVIETKNYRGYISGDQYGDKWVETIYQTKYLFYNPMKQNYAHTKALEELLRIKAKCLIPIVVFSDDCNIMVQANKPVITMKQLKGVIHSYQDVAFSKSEVKHMVSMIKRHNISSIWSRRRHILQIKAKVKREERSVKRGICPRCGGKLVKGNGKNTALWKCSNYPKCKFWAKYEEREKEGKR